MTTKKLISRESPMGYLGGLIIRSNTFFTGSQAYNQGGLKSRRPCKWHYYGSVL